MKEQTTQPVTRLQAQPLALLAQKEIERLITIGELAPGERLNENFLAHQLGVSRGPVREACRSLAAQGLVELIPNRGVFIRALSEEDASEVYDFRAGVFGYAGMLLAPRLTQQNLAHLRSLVDAMDAADQADDFDRYYPLNLEFHAYLVESTDNSRLIGTYNDLVRELHLFRTRGLLARHGMDDSNLEHRAIVDALASRDPQRAFNAMHNHVMSARHRALGDRSDLLK